MAYYDSLFESLGLSDWCAAAGPGGQPSMAGLLGKLNKSGDAGGPLFPFPSLDHLHQSCASIPQTRDMTAGVENLFLGAKSSLKLVLDPLTQPLSWLLDGALYVSETVPWWIILPVLLALTWFTARSLAVLALVAISFLFLGFIDHLDEALQTLSIIFVCTGICVITGVPIGILMSKSDRLQRGAIPILDLLQTLPTFVYLIPLIFLFSVTESKLFGIAIILYAIVPVVRLTDLGIRLVDRDVIEAADAFGMTKMQKLVKVELPLAQPNIMAGVNQTIMMSLAMVVIASLVSAPGLGVLVLRGIRNLELGVGLVAGFGIVLLAVILDRTSKAAMQRLHVKQDRH